MERRHSQPAGISNGSRGQGAAKANTTPTEHDRKRLKLQRSRQLHPQNGQVIPPPSLHHPAQPPMAPIRSHAPSQVAW